MIIAIRYGLDKLRLYPAFDGYHRQHSPVGLNPASYSLFFICERVFLAGFHNSNAYIMPSTAGKCKHIGCNLVVILA
jgi:hypothetical protein